LAEHFLQQVIVRAGPPEDAAYGRRPNVLQVRRHRGPHQTDRRLAVSFDQYLLPGCRRFNQFRKMGLSLGKRDYTHDMRIRRQRVIFNFEPLYRRLPEALVGILELLQKNEVVAPGDF